MSDEIERKIRFVVMNSPSTEDAVLMLGDLFDHTRNETIEQCAKVADLWRDWAVGLAIADIIRAQKNRGGGVFAGKKP